MEVGLAARTNHRTQKNKATLGRHVYRHDQPVRVTGNGCDSVGNAQTGRRQTGCGGGAILMRGDNMAAVSWITRCGGARDKRACLLVRMLGRLELKGGGTPPQNISRAYGTPQRTVSRDGLG